MSGGVEVSGGVGDPTDKSRIVIKAEAVLGAWIWPDQARRLAAWPVPVAGHFRTLPAGPRYQNRGCKAYELCAFNDGDRFSWTAQSQLISKVYLRKHPSLPYCYFLNAQDKKMVNDFKKARA